MKKIKTYQKGFTVLELLVVVGMISLLLGLVLTGLNAARRQSNDERKVANLRPIVIGLQDYFSICRQYPQTLDETEPPCQVLRDQHKTLKDVIGDISIFNINGTNSKYHYASFTSAGDSYPYDGQCTHFHLWVDFDENTTSFDSQKSNKSIPYSYAGQLLQQCKNSGSGLPAQSAKIFDIFK